MLTAMIDALQATRKLYDMCGGWSVQAFRDRLASPEILPD